MHINNYSRLNATIIDENIEENSKKLQIPSAVYEKILKTSLEQTGEDIFKIENAFEDNDYQKIKQLAHRIKGAYKNLRFNQIGDLCFKIEILAKEQADIKTMQHYHLDVKKIFSDLSFYFKNKTVET